MVFKQKDSGIKKYDIIVIGSGAGNNIAGAASSQGMKVALIENGPLGGTCLNRGCIPSKIWTHAADTIRNIDQAVNIGVKAEVEYIDFGVIQERLRSLVHGDSKRLEKGLKADPNIDLYQETALFTDMKVIQVGRKKITAEKIVIANGCRTHVPQVDGLSEVGYLMSENIFDIEDPPESLIIIGGGYKALEFAHFFSAIGTEVTVVGRNPRLMPNEEPEVSEMLFKKMSRLMHVHVNAVPIKFTLEDGKKKMTMKHLQNGEIQHISADEVLVCAGVRNNNDLLHPDISGVGLDEKGWIEVDEYLQTAVPGIFALGDTLGRTMFRHTANYQSMVVWENLQGHKLRIDERVVPHAAYTHPRVASVGLTEMQARKMKLDVVTGKANYGDTAKGYAMDELDSMVKVVIDHDSGRILGASICGSEADVLIQSIVFMMNTDKGTVPPILRSQVIHPSLIEVVDRAFNNIEHNHTH